MHRQLCSRNSDGDTHISVWYPFRVWITQAAINEFNLFWSQRLATSTLTIDGVIHQAADEGIHVVPGQLLDAVWIIVILGILVQERLDIQPTLGERNSLPSSEFSAHYRSGDDASSLPQSLINFPKTLNFLIENSPEQAIQVRPLKVKFAPGRAESKRREKSPSYASANHGGYRNAQP